MEIILPQFFFFFQNLFQIKNLVFFNFDDEKNLFTIFQLISHENNRPSILNFFEFQKNYKSINFNLKYSYIVQFEDF